MGKSPGKWIKSVLFGQKSSKSSLSKGKEISKSPNERVPILSKKDQTANLDEVPFSISEPVLISGGREIPKSEKGNAARLPITGLILASPKQDVNAETNRDCDLPEASDRMRLEQAATKAQAAFRGYLARRAFRSCQDIITLQAVIRGHLVRRQAVATVHCVQGIVKFQALVRGQIVRRSEIGAEVHRKSALEEKDALHLDSGQMDRAGMFLENTFVAKLLALIPTALPLHLQYGPEEPNSASDWLLRWTASRIWEPKLKPKKVHPTKQRKVETGKSRAKHSVGRMHSGIVENGSNHDTPESEKQKSISRRTNQSANSVKGHPQSEIEKVKSNLKKKSNSTRHVSSEREVDADKQSQNDNEQSNCVQPDLSGHSTDIQSDKQRVDLEGDVLKSTDQEMCTELPVTEVCDHTISSYAGQPKMISEKNDDALIADEDLKDDVPGVENYNVSTRRASLPAKHDYQDAGLSSVLTANDDQSSNENHKVSKRRASLPATPDEQDVHPSNETKVPSYMATTESAKAKVRGQVSPRFGPDAYEKNGLARRYSLPSSTNAKLTSSPRVQSIVQASGRGGIKIDRSLSSSRDGKMIQAEWKR